MSQQTKITQNLIKNFFLYDENKGQFIRIKDKGKGKKGSIVGNFDDKGYVHISFNGKMYLLHRLIWLYKYGKFPVHCLDHINGNPSDNRLCNLREATVSQNMHNQKLAKHNSSGVKGVRFHKLSKKWEASIKINKKSRYIGLFNTLFDAEVAIKFSREQIHKEFANHG